MCKSIREIHEPKQVPTDAAEELEKETTVEPPESDHPKCADLVVANGRWTLARIEPRMVSLRRKLDTSTLGKIIYCVKSHNGTNFQEKTISFVYKITLVDETHLHAGRHYFLTALNKSLRTSREANFRLIQAFNWSKDNFGEIHISQGLDWAFPSLSHYGS